MKKLKTLDKVLLGIAAFLFVFIVATVVIYTMNGWQYDTLITCVMGGGGAEVIATAVIQVAKYKHKGDNDDES
jgi:hypothetical protein